MACSVLLPMTLGVSRILMRGKRAVFSCKYSVMAARPGADRKSTRLNSSHLVISYAVFCLKKKINGAISVPYGCSLLSLISSSSNSFTVLDSTNCRSDRKHVDYIYIPENQSVIHSPLHLQ